MLSGLPRTVTVTGEGSSDSSDSSDGKFAAEYRPAEETFLTQRGVGLRGRPAPRHRRASSQYTINPPSRPCSSSLVRLGSLAHRFDVRLAAVKRPYTAEPTETWRPQLQALTRKENMTLAAAYGVLAQADGDAHSPEDTPVIPQPTWGREPTTWGREATTMMGGGGGGGRQGIDALCRELKDLLATVSGDPERREERREEERKERKEEERKAPPRPRALSPPTRQKTGGQGRVLPGLVDRMRREDEERVELFHRVALIRGRRKEAAREVLRRDRVRAETWTASNRQFQASQRRALREERTDAAQSHVQWRVDEKARKTLGVLARPEARAREREEQSRVESLQYSWAVLLAQGLAGVRLKDMAEETRGLKWRRVSVVAPEDDPASKKGVKERLPRGRPVEGVPRDPQKAAEHRAGRLMLRLVRKYRGAKLVRTFFRDVLTAQWIAVSVRVLRRAVVRIQSSFRDLRLIRMLRRCAGALMWDKRLEMRCAGVERKRDKIDRKLIALEKEEDTISKQGRSAGMAGQKRKQELKLELAELMNENRDVVLELGELRSIPESLRREAIEEYSLRNEKEHSKQVLQYVLHTKEVDKAVENYIAEGRRMQGAALLLGDTTPSPTGFFLGEGAQSSVFASGSMWKNKMNEKEAAKQALLEMGDITIPQAPHFRLVPPAADVDALVTAARDEVRKQTHTKQRQAVGALDTSPSAAPVFSTSQDVTSSALSQSTATTDPPQGKIKGGVLTVKRVSRTGKQNAKK
eukprot:Hpha_TRINITY_DN16057_c0_g2::TRINITY_DN16057_c0_g2_i1::g.118466::m.118466